MDLELTLYMIKTLFITESTKNNKKEESLQVKSHEKESDCEVFSFDVCLLERKSRIFKKGN